MGTSGDLTTVNLRIFLNTNLSNTNLSRAANASDISRDRIASIFKVTFSKKKSKSCFYPLTGGLG